MLTEYTYKGILKMTGAVWPSPADSYIDGMRQKATLDPVSKAKLTVPSVVALPLLSGFMRCGGHIV